MEKENFTVRAALCFAPFLKSNTLDYLSTNPTILKQLHLFTCVNNHLSNVGYTNFSNSKYTVYYEKISPILYRNTS